MLGSFTFRKAGIRDRFFHFPSEERHAEDYSDTRKIQRLRPGSNPRTRVPQASMLTTRPTKPLGWTDTHEEGTKLDNSQSVDDDDYDENCDN